MNPDVETTVDVVVVGAGIAGLTAAREIVAAGRSVVVLEARDRVGGRTVGHTLANGFTVEMGGQWVGQTQTEVLGLIKELGLETFPTYETGAAIRVLNGEVVRSEGVDLGLPDDVLVEVGRLQGELEKLAGTVSLFSPWTSPEAEDLDRQSLESWLIANTDDEFAHGFYRVLSRALLAAEPPEMSLLHFLFYIKSGGLLDIMTSTTGGAQEFRVVGGSHRISQRLADDLGEGAVRLNSVVYAIRQDEKSVVVDFDGGAVSGQRVIVTLPPTLAGRIRYRPPLPPVRDGLTQQMPMGSVIKVQAAFQTPFWREEGLSGFVISFDDLLSVTFDNSPPDGSCGVIVGLFEGAQARVAGAMDRYQRQRMVIGYLTKYFGPMAAQPTEYVEKDWNAEEFTRGCYGGRLGAGVWTQYGKALAEPIGRIHWAGAESAEVWNGYMDGAIRSARRAAAEALAGLR